MASENWYPRRWELNNSSCRVLKLLDSNGTWDKTAVQRDWKPAVKELPDVIQSCKTQPGTNAAHPALIFACRINAELLDPGHDIEIGILLAAAAGDLGVVQKFATEMNQMGHIPPFHDIAFVATLIGHPNILEYCVDQNLEVDSNISWAAARTLRAEILQILLPLNVFEVKKYPEFLTGLLEEAIGLELTEKPKNHDAIPLVGLLLKEGAIITGDIVAIAARCQSVHFMRFLLRHCTELDLSSCGVLHSAVVANKLEMVKFLLDDGLNPNTSSFCCSMSIDRNTYVEFGYPLNYAVSQRHIELVRALIEKGADPTLSCDVAPNAFTYIGDDRSPDAETIRDLLNMFSRH